MWKRCIRSFKTEKFLEEHFQWCARGHHQIEQPPKISKFSHSSYHKELSPLRVIYTDIESYIQSRKHLPAAVASYEVWPPQKTQEQNSAIIESWSGEDCIIDFLRYIDLTAQAQHMHINYMTRQSIVLSPQYQKTFDQITHCPRCCVKFDDTEHSEVGDHCHITGKFRSALCHKSTENYISHDAHFQSYFTTLKL